MFCLLKGRFCVFFFREVRIAWKNCLLRWGYFLCCRCCGENGENSQVAGRIVFSSTGITIALMILLEEVLESKNKSFQATAKRMLLGYHKRTPPQCNSLSAMAFVMHHAQSNSHP